MAIDEEVLRKDFEDAAFNQRFIHGITNNPKNRFVFAVDCPFKSDFVAKNEKGDYVEPFLDAMWWAWKKAAQKYST